jgi:acyl-CoA synthetase (NDP forming)
VTHSPDLEHLFNPRSIAVVGASNKVGKMGNLFIEKLAAQFRGKLYPVNPGESEIAGIPAHRRVEDLPDGIDMLIALVPAEGLVAVAEACRPGQVRFLLAVSSGFAEVSNDGAAMQQKLVAAARARGTRVLGPNIVGVMNGVLGLNASMMPELPPGGPGLSCLTQSGGFGMALSMYALDHGMRFAKFCDIGNTADIDAPEVIEFLAEDSDTRVIGLFLESVRDPEKFRRALENAAARKPVVLTAVGVTAAGRRASLAHLGLSAEAATVSGTLPDGFLVAETALDLLDRSRALLWQHKATGSRVAILTGSGGIGAELADLALGYGLEVPSMSPALQKRVGKHLPYYAGMKNPIDCTPIWWDYPKIYPAVLDELAQSGEVDLAIVSVTDVAATLPDLAVALTQWTQRVHTLPVVVYWGARHRDHDNMLRIERAGVPCYPSTREAVSAAAALAG